MTSDDCTKPPSDKYTKFLQDKADKVGNDFGLKIGFTDKLRPYLREENFEVKEGSNRNDFKMLESTGWLHVATGCIRLSKQPRKVKLDFESGIVK